MINIIRGAAVLVVMLLPMTSSADVIYSTPAAGCVPADVDIQAQNYSRSGHGIEFRVGYTGDIRLICSVNDPLTKDFVRGAVTVIDSDGRGNESRVRIMFRKATLGSEVSTILGAFDSNDHLDTSIYTEYLDFADFESVGTEWLWFEVIISRSSTTYSPKVLGISVYDSTDD